MRTLSFLAEDFLENPWPHYRRFRKEQPVWWSPEIKMFCVFDYAGIREALTEPGYSVEYPFRISRQILGTTLLDIDGAKHKSLRKNILPLLGAEQMGRFQSGAMKGIVAAALDGMGSGRIDFIADYCEKIPVRVICSYLGLPLDDADWIYGKMMYLINHLDGSTGDFGKASETRMEMEDYVLKVIRTGTPGNGAGVAPEPFIPASKNLGLEEEEVLRLALLFLAAGIETSVAALGNTMVCLLRNPEHLDKLPGSPDMVSGIIQEALRLEPPQHDTVRFSVADTTLHGVKIPKGSALKLILASGNRDEGFFERAEEFLPDRHERHTLSFGHGPHACLGRGFAMRELELALGKFFEKFRILPSCLGEPPVIRGSTFRQPKQLNLNVALI